MRVKIEVLDVNARTFREECIEQIQCVHLGIGQAEIFLKPRPAKVGIIELGPRKIGIDCKVGPREVGLTLKLCIGKAGILLKMRCLKSWQPL